jgi:putative (di)nucleoside polyphosphate hydrolase
MHSGQYFRAGVGSVIYTPDKKLVVFKRAGDHDIWQFQQGGMDGGETPEDTLWRELHEETALVATDFSAITPYPYTTSYEFPPSLQRDSCRGQVHRWFFLALNPDVTISLESARDKEFSSYALVTPAEFIEMSSTSFKSKVYVDLIDFFATIS